ncbi:hypothetical protein PV08_11055 [Exophiala spinifera]|uniref:Uncharacterized protein n=1 Tax=Exophiala spinifera TaxID=91928 RepID=A0A0D2AUD9_9EURO|nr:uncharacterized protein PV08_11055 [Exophiala spinifera]KIW10095.1 hypothetical protein PV08_11055 [Exophiala spinifera]
MSTELLRLQGAQTDGRTANVRYRQDQLQSLHAGLCLRAEDLCTAVAKDTGCTATEASMEFYTAMEGLRLHYDGLNFERELKNEYSVVDDPENANPNLSLGVGLVYIIPSNISPLNAAMAPLTAAIASGNCVALELQPTLRTLPALLGAVLLDALDNDTFAICKSRPDDLSMLKNGTLVDQTSSEAIIDGSVRVLKSPSESRTVAIVDRTADLDRAAKALVTARFSFCGRSYYAPDLVLVNEFIKKPFLEAVLREALPYLDDHEGQESPHRDISSLKKRMTQAAADGMADILSLGSRGSIVDIKSRSSWLLEGKVNLPILAILSVTSLEDAIDYSNLAKDYHPVTGRPYLASYVFANASTAKYLAQFINAQESFLNGIPPLLLVAPPKPLGGKLPQSPSQAYSPSMFQVLRQIHGTRQSAVGLSGFIEESSSKLIRVARNELLDAALQPLRQTGQAFQAREVGFFEQGILTGLVVFGGPVIIVFVGGAFAGARYLYKLLR